MSYKEQQTEEVEALQAIYQEEELEVINAKYPDISVRINLKSYQEGEDPDEEEDFELSLVVELPENYPDVIPRISIEGLDEVFDELRTRQAIEVLEKVAEENIGMVMVFTIVSAMQDEIGKLVEEKKLQAEKRAEAEKEKVEAIARKKFEGTVVTQESFKAWKVKFDLERRALIEKKEQEREAILAGKLTGRELFLRDATLCLSDVAMLEQNVEIDESLFDDQDLDGLDLDDSDED